MPLQNRVDPWGNILISPYRGTCLGNRGILHNEKKQLIKNYQHKNWVTCLLEFKGRKRALMSPHHYTELFFLDEATALAAGHRPCCECRRKRYIEFNSYWKKANLNTSSESIKSSDIDKSLHEERMRLGVKNTYLSKIKDLPDGTIFSNKGSAYLKLNNMIYLWSLKGYQLQNKTTFPKNVDVLTPKSLVKIFKLGFKPEIHESAYR